MSGKLSAGLLMFRRKPVLEVLLVHPGGPYWAKKDLGSWSVPKGEYESGEDALQAAQREFEEETGFRPAGEFLRLTPRKQSGGKPVSIWAVEGDLDAAAIHSNTFSMEWPPRSGNQMEFPEIDRAEWFDLSLARQKILAGQAGFLDELESLLDRNNSSAS